MEAIDDCRQRVFKKLWTHYYDLVPYAPKIEADFKAKKDAWIEDHVAYRTLPGENTGKHVLQEAFEALGYKREDDYHFEEKNLDAFWMSPPDNQGESYEASPKIFISELMAEKFSQEFQDTVHEITKEVRVSPLPAIRDLLAKVKAGDESAKDGLVDHLTALLTEGPAWSRPSKGRYHILKSESDYAAWTYLFGHQINHFTVSVHLMDSFSSIQSLGEYLEGELNIPMNHSGGLVKGTAEIKLEQIATMAVKRPFTFQDGIEDVSYGFVEFAKRYPLEGRSDDHKWQSYYQGFVAANADKIFESTYK
ncbi:DUF1338 domain-containing protein [Pseudobacteriovorax antillogorgiicola]|uniref:2-oxoadipate dioxygenase/decarboxylase n=1 Tax=Pseudobacteriovorax antillogorgiicola TaxID=1513793 RepID=A0A1Y6CVN1_9BACT|nr:DUF1338 domain-containing protein [Pseudobacteriovorax antillogorgiicola]TCS43483.1 uncharacterized protein DUF1338 [Pseudobacteriovorax antillogorgiicola]SMF81247.1 protein of unknown function [Pseudobacteriovorax antillogorgiicola]